MNKFLVSIILLLFCSASYAQKTSWEEDNLKEHVKELNVYVHSRSAEISKVPSKVNFDEKQIYRYNKNGLCEEIIYAYNSNKEVHQFIAFKYDEYGNKIEQAENTMNGRNIHDVKFTSIYDSNHNRLERRKYNINGDLKERVRWNYDKKNKKTKKIIYDREGERRGEIQYINSTNKQLIKISDEKGKFTGTVEILLDNQGREILQKLTNPDGTLKSSRQSKYNERGDVIEIVEKNKVKNQDFVVRSKYLYDENDNWIEREDYVHDLDFTKKRLLTKVVREIVYY